MSLARPLIWRYGQVTGSATAPGFFSTEWGEADYRSVIFVAAGETVLRTRLQGFLSFGVQGQSGPTFNVPQLWYHDMSVRMGVYCNPALASDGVPSSVGVDTSDGWFVQSELMTPHAINYYAQPAGGAQEEVLFKCDAGTSQSFGKRGPYTVEEGAVFLCWEFAASDTFWLLDDEAFFGYMGGVMQVSALIQTAGE